MMVDDDCCGEDARGFMLCLDTKLKLLKENLKAQIQQGSE